MATPKLTGFLISITLFGFFIGIFGLLYSDIGAKYGADYQNDSLEVFNKLDEMHLEAKNYQQNISRIAEGEKTYIEKGIDIVGGVWSTGISSIKITFNSVQVFLGMADAAEIELNKAGLGATAGYFRIMVGTIILILFFIGILLALVVKWRL